MRHFFLSTSNVRLRKLIY